MQKKSPERPTAELKLRLSQPLRRALVKAAEFNGTSLNTEIIVRVERSLSGLAEEALRLTFPSDWEHLVAAYRLGRLQTRPDDVKRMKAVLTAWVDKFNVALEG